MLIYSSKLRFFGRFCLVLPASPTFFNGLLSALCIRHVLQRERAGLGFNDLSGLGCSHAIENQAGSLAYLLAMRFKVERLVAGQAQQLQV